MSWDHLSHTVGVEGDPGRWAAPENPVTAQVLLALAIYGTRGACLILWISRRVWPPWDRLSSEDLIILCCFDSEMRILSESNISEIEQHFGLCICLMKWLPPPL